MNNGILWLESNNFEPPVELKYNKAKHYHVTLQYNVFYEDVKHYVNREVQCLAIENCWNDDIQALKVILRSDIASLCNNKVPHMTLSHREGISPVKSNDMLVNLHNKETLFDVMNLSIKFHKFG
jgi:hypothetical protein